jgi:hypothetical protein
MRGKDDLKDPRVDKRIILNWILKELKTSVDWIQLAKDTDMADSLKYGNNN